MFDELKPCPFCGGTAHLFVNNGVSLFVPIGYTADELDRDNPFC